jgi:hypothetical protein
MTRRTKWWREMRSTLALTSSSSTSSCTWWEVQGGAPHEARRARALRDSQQISPSRDSANGCRLFVRLSVAAAAV